MDPAARRQFLSDYATVRAAEGRGSNTSSYYRALPDRDLSGNNGKQWRIRARSYRYFERKILAPLEKRARRPLDILDLGAGNGWMSYRLAERGQRPVALDIFCDPMDGLGALRHYPFSIRSVAAEFDAIPFREGSFDVAIYNSSFHYSPDYRITLREVRRCLRPNGLLVIMDTPLYRRPEHGESMRQERRQYFEKTYGFRSDALGSVEFLDRKVVARLSRELNLEMQCRRPWYGWQWAMRPWKARLAGRRPPSRFVIFTGRFRER